MKLLLVCRGVCEGLLPAEKLGTSARDVAGLCNGTGSHGQHDQMLSVCTDAQDGVLPAEKLGPSAKGVEGLKLVWPTVQEIRDSVEGWCGGNSVPGPSKNVNKPFLQPYWHRCCMAFLSQVCFCTDFCQSVE